MWYLPWRIRPPTGSEQTVLFWGIFVLLVGFGAVCLFFGYRALAEKAQEAAKLIRGGHGQNPQNRRQDNTTLPMAHCSHGNTPFSTLHHRGCFLPRPVGEHPGS